MLLEATQVKLKAFIQAQLKIAKEKNKPLLILIPECHIPKCRQLELDLLAFINKELGECGNKILFVELDEARFDNRKLLHGIIYSGFFGSPTGPTWLEVIDKAQSLGFTAKPIDSAANFYDAATGYALTLSFIGLFLRSLTPRLISYLPENLNYPWVVNSLVMLLAANNLLKPCFIDNAMSKSSVTKRDSAMVDNLEADTDFDVGLTLIGAAHHEGMVAELKAADKFHLTTLPAYQEFTTQYEHDKATTF